MDFSGWWNQRQKKAGNVSSNTIIIRLNMAYNDFTLEAVEKTLGVTPQPADLFKSLVPLPVPPWLSDLLAKGMQLSLLSEKARSEFIVVPILLASRELSHEAIAIYSGQRLDVNPERGLVGECDFILAATPPVPLLRAPLLTIVEAKKNDIEGGLGQCVAQMVGARLFNETAGRASTQVHRRGLAIPSARAHRRLDRPNPILHRLARFWPYSSPSSGRGPVRHSARCGA
jgi:hypothetical protein